MVDDHGLGAALRLGPLAGVVDDEGVHVRQRSERRLRVTGRGERERLAGQPFEVAVLAHVHHRVHPGPQPGVEGEVAVRRHERGVVVGSARVDVVSARGLNAHRHVAQSHGGHREAGHTVRAFHEERVPFRRSPARVHRVAHLRGKAGEEAEIVVERKAFANLASRRFRIGRSRGQRRDERVAVRGDAVDGVSRRRHRPEQLERPRGSVEADAVAEAPVPVGVVREHDADASLAGGRCGERDPGLCERGAELDTIGAGRVGHYRALGARVEAGLGLEGHRAGRGCGRPPRAARRSSRCRAPRGPAFPPPSSPRLRPRARPGARGRPQASNGPGRRSVPGVATAKPVVFSTRSASASFSIRSTRSADTGSLRLET